MYSHCSWLLDMATYGPQRGQDPLDQRQEALISLKVIRNSLSESEISDLQDTCQWNFHVSDYKCRVYASDLLLRLDINLPRDTIFANCFITQLFSEFDAKKNSATFVKTDKQRRSVLI